MIKIRNQQGFYKSCNICGTQFDYQFEDLTVMSFNESLYKKFYIYCPGCKAQFYHGDGHW